MTPANVCREVYRAGLSMRVDGAHLVVKPAGRLTPQLREVLLANKAELIVFLTEAEHTAADLVEAAMRACEFHGDGEQQREQMRRDVLGVPPDIQADLLDYFRSTYPPREGSE